MEFIDLKTQYKGIKDKVLKRIETVLDHGGYVMGPEVKEFETALSAFCGAKHAISCSNGTDAIALALRAKGIAAGDAILVPAFTFAATAEVVAWFNATPVFVDVDDKTFNMCPKHLEASILDAKAKGLKLTGIIAVDLFGQPADYNAIHAIAKKHGLFVIADSAQGFGSTLGGKHLQEITEISTTSFFPAKPLGGYGDGGALFTNDDDLAKIIRSCRVHGQGDHKYNNVRIGMNGRLDTIQAAVLLEKLAIFPAEIIARQKVADRYNEAFKGKLQTPIMISGATSVWAQYTLVSNRRDAIMDHLKSKGVPSVVYYPKPLSHQDGYKHYPIGLGGVPVSERLSGEVFSLPMHPYMDEATQEQIIKVVLEAI